MPHLGVLRVSREGVVCPPTRPVARHTLPVDGCEKPSSHAVENISERLLHRASRQKSTVFGDGASSRLHMLGCGNGAGAEAALEI